MKRNILIFVKKSASLASFENMIIPQSIFSLKIPCNIFFDCSSLIELFKEINNLSLLLNNALLSSSLNEEIKDSSVFFGIFIAG